MIRIIILRINLESFGYKTIYDIHEDIGEQINQKNTFSKIRKPITSLSLDLKSYILNCIP